MNFPSNKGNLIGQHLLRCKEDSPQLMEISATSTVCRKKACAYLMNLKQIPSFICGYGHRWQWRKIKETW